MLSSAILFHGLTLLKEAQKESFEDYKKAYKNYEQAKNFIKNNIESIDKESYEIFIYMADAVHVCIIEQRKLENNSQQDKESFIYFVINGNDTAIKIGVSIDPKKRLASLQIGNNEKLWIIKITKGTKKDEYNLHQKFKHLRLEGEWFKYTKELKNYIDYLPTPTEYDISTQQQASSVL